MGNQFQNPSWVYPDTVTDIYKWEGEEDIEDICVHMYLGLLGYTGSLTAGHSLAFCAFGSWVGCGEGDKCLVAMGENFIPNTLPCQALFSSTAPP